MSSRLHQCYHACFTVYFCCQEVADALFQGCGYVPDILSLQAWLECAWQSGFDVAGGDMLGNSIQNSQQWIGTTECAALFRFFGLKAEIIDFTGVCRAPNFLQRCHFLLSQTVEHIAVSVIVCRHAMTQMLPVCLRHAACMCAAALR